MFGFLKKSVGVSWIVVFLGNPGDKYRGTRHNAGFMTAAKCERAEDVRINKLRFKALTGQVHVGGESVLLMMPQTYMNLSGEAVQQAAKFYKVPPERVVVVSDDISLPVGKLRIRSKGSAGGHNGLKSIIGCLGSDCFPRVKIGVGQPPHPDYDMADWVLGSFRGQDAETMDQAAERAWEAVKTLIVQGTDKAMNKYN